MEEILDRFHMELVAFGEDREVVLKMLKKLDDKTLDRLGGLKIIVTPLTWFVAPPPNPPKLMTGLTRTFPWHSFYPAGNILIILGAEPTAREFYHEIGHASGIESEEEAQEFAKQLEVKWKGGLK